jgi:hypothetical protein
MRTMQIRPFPGPRNEFKDLGSLIKRRLTDDIVLWPKQAVPLLGYMAWPTDAAAQRIWLKAHRPPLDRPGIGKLQSRFKIIQQHWARIADIVHHHYDLVQGQHQKQRGGASIGKAIALVAATATSKGTGSAKLWEIWKTYKDVAHLITAAVLVSAEAQMRHRKAPHVRKLHQLQPHRMAMLLPDLIIAVAIAIERYGLEHVAQSRTEPMFNPKSLWRIPDNINLTPLSPPARKITSIDIVVLNARRAGNRGSANRRKTTPVLA